jgi:4-alpha-glucanotransferase
MNEDAVRQAARDAGIAVDWTDANGTPQQVSVASLQRLLDRLGHQVKLDPPLITGTVGQPIPFRAEGAAELVLEDGTRRSFTMRAGALPPIAETGYHCLRIGQRETIVAVAPDRCVTLAEIAGGRKLWGLAVQLYSLKRPGDFGIGDTTGLRALGTEAALVGGDAIALSPTHSLFPDDPTRYGPYSPSSRLFLNPLLADPADALGKLDLSADTDQALIDWPQDSRAKYAMLRGLFERFTPTDAFRRFVEAGGKALAGHVAFEAQQSKDGAPVDYFLLLQWIADTSFAATQRALRQAGMKIGLIADLAIGLDRGGAQVGADPQDFLAGLSIGAPPDAFNAHGQDWGLTTFSPQALVASRFSAFIATLRAAMRHAGGVRIDHAMGLKRLWLVPDGASPSEGAYLAYPVDDLMRLLALESHRHGAVVIGEDLGTLPPDFHARCREIGMAGMDVLWFQRDETGFLPLAKWRDDSVAMTTTHDLPTVAGWWRGADLELRRGLGLTQESDVADRAEDRVRLWGSFADAGVAAGDPPDPEEAEPVVDAAIAFVANAPAPLALIPLEDIMATVEQPNLPGTIDQHPNWRRRFAGAATDLLLAPGAARRLQILKSSRP